MAKKSSKKRTTRESRTITSGATLQSRSIKEAATVQAVSEKRLSAQWPWLFLALGLVLIVFALPHDWVYAWSVDVSPGWSQASVFVLGSLGLALFLHALLTAQMASSKSWATEEDHRRPWRVIESALTNSGYGVLFGTLLALFSFDAAPAGLKLTSLISDLATVGAIFGLAACTPIQIAILARSLNRLWKNDRGALGLAASGLLVVDAVLSLKFQLALIHLVFGP